ncbi:hypothetical protein AX17_002725 [Amanita inopinata Kibby_2008]|nr:hypothetical protein AX17_002725 [Amanita inopinata Kibby_2008]
MSLSAVSQSPSLSARRGSMSAADPYGAHAHLRRPSSSTLTIVRVPAAVVPLQDPPAAQRRFGRRPVPAASTPSQPHGTGPTEGRLSFAFTSFSHSPSRVDGPCSPSSSPTSSPRLRPSSPHRFSSGIIGKPRLSADQLVDLARQAISARSIPQHPSSPSSSSAPHSPVLPVRPHSPLAHAHPQAPLSIAQPAPATFTLLPDDILLPFIHRAEEVSALISSPPSAKLFSLLAQTFGKQSKQSISHEETVNPALSEDPSQWLYSQLVHHLTKIDRNICSDADWVYATRKCILSHSELIWERVKAALGVPPELDIDETLEEQFGDSLHDDNPIEDSPLMMRGTKRLPSEPLARQSSGDEIETFEAEVGRRLHRLQEASLSDRTSDASVTPHESGQLTVVSATPHGGIHSPSDTGLLIGSFSPPAVPLISKHEGKHLTIQPLLSSSASSSSHPPPLSLPSSLAISASDGLGDIAESAEDEAEEENADQSAQTESLADSNLVAPSQIHGLRISTVPISPSQSDVGSPIAAPVIPSHLRRSSSLSSSLSDITALSGLSSFSPGQHLSSSQSESDGAGITSVPSGENVAAQGIPFIGTSLSRIPSGGHASRRTRTRPFSMSGFDPREWDVPYNPVGDRAPGNPLFPSNFARLAVGPTLRANNPNLRSPVNPPPSGYQPGMSRIQSGDGAGPALASNRTRSQSWAVPFNKTAEATEFAITLSEGSVGE